jgi:hypothetical protein
MRVISNLKTNWEKSIKPIILVLLNFSKYRRWLILLYGSRRLHNNLILNIIGGIIPKQLEENGIKQSDFIMLRYNQLFILIVLAQSLV